jgi:hypothetical protein
MVFLIIIDLLPFDIVEKRNYIVKIAVFNFLKLIVDLNH